MRIVCVTGGRNEVYLYMQNAFYIACNYPKKDIIHEECSTHEENEECTKHFR
jgi:hypothetical protein